jgi:hypothetical protein
MLLFRAEVKESMTDAVTIRSVSSVVVLEFIQLALRFFSFFA